MPRTEDGPTTKAQNPSIPLQFLLLFDIWVRSMIWAVALTATLLVMSRMPFARSLSWDGLTTWGGAWALATTLTNFILLFNVAYVLTLVVVRLPFPRPERGVHRTDKSFNRTIILAGMIALLTKARYHAPFPGIFVSQLASIMPFRWLLGCTMGPRTESSFFLDPNLMDPWGIKIGKNVTIGFASSITCHLQERDHIIMDEVVIEDDVSIGAYTGIACGVHIKRGAIIEPFSVVKPSTVVGEYELWGGLPARMKGSVRPGRGTSPESPTPDG